MTSLCQGYYESCSTTYGAFATNAGGNTCRCMNGYHFENKYGRTTCVKDPTCQDLYGWNSYEIGNTCYCNN
ncbi:MAG: hypothetical protein LBD75_01575 [Candidatus Peribacteria bacterium]|nr:hypothetical protein [Candidatus Peribacteria bacterium]